MGAPHVSGRPCNSNPLFNIRAYGLYPLWGKSPNPLWGKSSIPPPVYIEPPSQWVLGALSPGVKWPGRKAKQTAPHSVQVKNAWNYTCAATYIRVLVFNLLGPTGYVMHHGFNIQQLYALPAPYLCVLYLSQNKQRLVPLTA